MNCGSEMTCWRRLRDWQAAGVWKKIWQRFLDELGGNDLIEWSVIVVDASATRAIFGAEP